MSLEVNRIYLGDSLDLAKQLDNNSIDTIVTSPPYYGLRDYQIDGQWGLEQTMWEYLARLWGLFWVLKGKLKKEGSCWVNMGDSYNNPATNSNSISFQRVEKSIRIKSKLSNQIQNKSLLLIPSRFAIGMIDMGWILRNVIIWHKPNAMCNPCKDRFTVDFEYVFFFVKHKKYYFKQQFEPFKHPKKRAKLNSKKLETLSVLHNNLKRENLWEYLNNEGRNKRCIWSISSACIESNHGNTHVAMYPKQLVRTILNAGCSEGGLVLDPFMGSGTTGIVAGNMSRNWIGFEISQAYIDEALNRMRKEQGLFSKEGI